jgi:hypothetical protein
MGFSFIPILIIVIIVIGSLILLTQLLIFAWKSDKRWLLISLLIVSVWAFSWFFLSKSVGSVFIPIFATAILILPILIFSLLFYLLEKKSVVHFLLTSGLVLIFLTISTVFAHSIKTQELLSYCKTFLPYIEDYKSRNSIYPATIADIKNLPRPKSIFMLTAPDKSCHYITSIDSTVFSMSVTDYFYSSQFNEWLFVD